MTIITWRYHRTPTRGATGVGCRSIVGIGVWAALFSAGCNSLQQPDHAALPTVDYVDAKRYAGKWYEIARYPNNFERGCQGVTAEYRVIDSTTIEVINTCRDSNDLITSRIRGTARIDDRDTNAKLKVSFFWPFSGPYWIIDLDPDYRYAVVGEPARNFFWILSRTPSLDEQTIDGIIAKMPAWQYDPDRLYFTPQNVD